MADICPTCGDLCPPEASRCDCGERLQPSAPVEVSTDVETLHDLRADLTRLAFELGATLNTVMDDDERDQLHGHVEKVINDELYAGSVNRAQVAVLLAVLPAATVTDISSRRIQTAAVRPDFEAGDGRLQEVKE